MDSITLKANATRKPISRPYRYGWEDALHGHAFAPEMWFTHKSDKIEYALGFEQVRGVSEITRQFTASVDFSPAKHKAVSR